MKIKHKMNKVIELRGNDYAGKRKDRKIIQRLFIFLISFIKI